MSNSIVKESNELKKRFTAKLVELIYIGENVELTINDHYMDV